MWAHTGCRGPVEDVAKEPGHDETIGRGRRHAPALEVVPLLLVDGPDGGGMAGSGMDAQIKDGGPDGAKTDGGATFAAVTMLLSSNWRPIF